MKAGVPRVETRADLAEAIARAQLAGADHSAVLMQALYRGRIALDFLRRDTPVSRVKAFIRFAQKPALIVCGDDDDAPSGPSGWPHTRRLMQWCQHLCIHAAVGRRQEYEALVAETLSCGRVLLVETSSAVAPAWFMAARRWANHAIVHVIEPGPGQVWPNSRKPGALH